MTPAPLEVGVVVLTWNGADDTLACLRSLLATTPLPRWIVLADNGSVDGTVDRVLAALGEAGGPGLRPLGAEETVPAGAGQGRVRRYALGGAAEGTTFVLVENGANLGFAAGNNVALRWLLAQDVAQVLLLNNDTELAPDAIARLMEGMRALPRAQALVPQIRYWRRPETIWNCGGDWHWIGRPVYAYADQPAARLDGAAPFRVGFVTGCALLLRAAWLREHGLLTERFFFGEEDVDLSWRLRAAGADAMWCWPSSVVLHKVGASVERAADRALLPRAYVHYLNRLVFLRSVEGTGPRWQLQRAVVLAYLAHAFVRRFGVAPRTAWRALRDLAREARERDEVGAAHFHHVMREKFTGAR